MENPIKMDDLGPTTIFGNIPIASTVILSENDGRAGPQSLQKRQTNKVGPY